jgi:hypothetical protein
MTLLDKYKPGPITQFSGLKLTAAAAKTFAPKPLQASQLKVLEDVCAVTKNTTIPTLYLRVVFVSEDKMGQYSRYRIIRVKDRSSRCHFITLFGKIRNEVEMGQVYQFSSLVAQSYRGEGEELGRLKSHSPTKISQASKEIEHIFQDVKIGDIFLTGTILSHESPNCYECCGNCKRSKFKNTTSNKCIFCGEIIPENTTFHDFSVVLQVLDDIKEEIFLISVFRKQFSFEFNSLTEDQFNQEIIKLHMTRASFDCDQEKHSDTLRAITFHSSDPLD